MFTSLTFFIIGALSPDSKVITKIDKIQLAEIVDIRGYYTCKGVEASGKTYSGIAVITKKNNVYIVQWVVGEGATFTGIGIRQGNNFSASWAVVIEKSLVRGINMYRIEPGPRLIGRWATLPGNGRLQSETLMFLKALEEGE